jgi:hypothetical protein
MKELKANNQIVETETKQTGFGVVTYIRTKHNIDHNGHQINIGVESIIAVKVYEQNQTYKLIYLIIDSNGIVNNILHETEGILPTLFKSPKNEVWLSLMPYHPDKDMEISIPFFNRTPVELPKPNRPFAGIFFGTNENSAFFISCDSFSPGKADKLLRIEFKDSTIKKKHNLKIELPSNNSAIVIDNQIHLLSHVEAMLVHRLIDETGKILQHREIPYGDYNCTEIISLSFSESSAILATKDDSLYLITILPNGGISEKVLLQIGSDLYSLWSGIELSENTMLYRFTHENGNGWFVIRNNEIIECFMNNTDQAYTNPLNKQVIDFEFKDLILSGSNKTKENAYALTFYPRTENRKPNKTIIVLNRNVV